MENDNIGNIEPRDLWMRPDGTYLSWSQEVIEETRVGVIRSATGVTCEVGEQVLGRPSLTTAEVVAALTPHVKLSLAKVYETLRTLSPELASGTGRFDLGAELPRILQRQFEAPESMLGALDEFAQHASLLVIVVDFGPASDELTGLIGSGLEGLFGRHAVAPAEDAGRVARVQSEVRAELDKHAATRPPMSFDFAELKKPPTA